MRFGICGICQKEIAVGQDGKLPVHSRKGLIHCSGSRHQPQSSFDNIQETIENGNSSSDYSPKKRPLIYI